MTKKKAPFKRTNKAGGPSDSADRYNGPIQSPGAALQIDSAIRTVSTVASQTTNGTGVLASVFQTDCSAISQFTGISADYDEWRCLGLKIEFVPVNKNNQTLSVTHALDIGIGFSVSDMNNTTALAALADASEYASAKFHSMADCWEHEWRAEGRNLMTWNPVGSGPTYFGAIKIYSTANIASQVIGYVFQRWLVQFRGTK